MKLKLGETDTETVRQAGIGNKRNENDINLK